MDAHKLQLKIFVSPDSARGVELESFIPVFHRWIKDHTLPELTIDVANYAHVPKGPGVVLIGHGSDYFVDEADGRLGLLHNRKRAGLPPTERLSDLARRTLHVAALLERDPALGGKLRFSTGELLFRINDRLAAPNMPATFAALKGELDTLAAGLFAGPFQLAPVGGPKDLFTVRITSATAPALGTLLERAGGPPDADASLVP
ncbi:MAG TPA: hypothetical protein VH374_12010 [Polyangia bacterium]|jgi:hypothetical protein|nr:hypothetical protein [Polyangia bacterium]